IQLARAGHCFAVEADDHVAFAQAGFFGRAVLHYFSHADAADFAHAIGAHIFLADVFGMNPQECSALEEEGEVVVALERPYFSNGEIKFEIKGVVIKPRGFGVLWSRWSFRSFGFFLRAHDTADDETATENN